MSEYYYEEAIKDPNDISAKKEKSSRLISIILSVLAVVLLVLSLIEFGLFGVNFPLRLSKIFGLTKNTVQVVGFDSCINQKGVVSLDVPKKCLINNKLFYQQITNGDYYTYVSNLEDEAAKQDIILFAPANLKNMDIITRTQDGVKNMIYRSISNEGSYSEMYVFQPNSKTLAKPVEAYWQGQDGLAKNPEMTNNIVTKLDITAPDTYKNTNVYLINLGNKMVGDYDLQIYTQVRNNYLLIHHPVSISDSYLNDCIKQDWGTSKDIEADITSCTYTKLTSDSKLIDTLKNQATTDLDTFKP